MNAKKGSQPAYADCDPFLLFFINCGTANEFAQQGKRRDLIEDCRINLRDIVEHFSQSQCQQIARHGWGEAGEHTA